MSVMIRIFVVPMQTVPISLVASVALVKMVLVTMHQVNVLISRNVTQVTTHVTSMHHALTLKEVLSVNVIPVGMVMDIHVMTSTNVSLMSLTTAQILPIVITSMVGLPASANQDSPPMTQLNQ
jgi:hypothetical protein